MKLGSLKGGYVSAQNSINSRQTSYVPIHNQKIGMV
jgi:hypothetical protein